jgi:hypothetical protein
MTTTDQTETIRRLNNLLRTTFLTGWVLLTQGVMTLNQADRDAILTNVREFDVFTPDNDPHGEHDFGAFTHGETRFFWKIDYYAPDMQHHSENPADPAQTRRVLTVMLADEY